MELRAAELSAQLREIRPKGILPKDRVLRLPFEILLLTLAWSGTAYAQFEDYELPPIRYSSSLATDRIAKLASELESGAWTLDTTDEKRFLREFLRRLDIPVESQVLVFSKTSQQNDRISPRTPRALYYSDDIYIGWVQGGGIEIAAADPKLGIVFYFFDHRRRSGKLEFERDRQCLSCHGGGRTRHMPGLLVRSVFADRTGLPLFARGSFQTTPQSPLEERWGGYYVTGESGSHRHMGNSFLESRAVEAEFDADHTARSELGELFPVEPYLKKTSDIISLMVLEHQIAAHNAIIRLNLKTQRAIQYQADLDRNDGKTPDPKTMTLRGTALRIVERAVTDVVDELLFVGEVKLRGNIKGCSEFLEAFSSKRKPNKDDRALRDFQLRTRLFRHRMSYMIHSPAFDALPPRASKIVYRELWRILSAENAPEKYDHLTPNEKRHIVKILLETKKGLPSTWKELPEDGEIDSPRSE